MVAGVEFVDDCICGADPVVYDGVKSSASALGRIETWALAVVFGDCDSLQPVIKIAVVATINVAIRNLAVRYDNFSFFIVLSGLNVNGRIVPAKFTSATGLNRWR